MNYICVLDYVHYFDSSRMHNRSWLLLTDKSILLLLNIEQLMFSFSYLFKTV